MKQNLAAIFFAATFFICAGAQATVAEFEAQHTIDEPFTELPAEYKISNLYIFDNN